MFGRFIVPGDCHEDTVLKRNFSRRLRLAHPLYAGEIAEAGLIVCAIDKWDEKEVAVGQKLVESTSRCVIVPDDAAAQKGTEACVATYEYLPDKSWTAKGSCTDTYGKDTRTLTWEEGSALKEYTYRITGGTGRFANAGGAGTYTYENLTDTLSSGRFKGTLVLP